MNTLFLDLQGEDRKVWFTADQHFGDERLIGYGRPFDSVKQMNDIIVENYNKLVGPDDIVFHLGDIVYDYSKASNFYSAAKLSGEKYLIRGNYDTNDRDLTAFKIFYKDNIVDKINLDLSTNNGTFRFHLNHYPRNVSSERFTLCGHVHAGRKLWRNALNVGVDCWGFRPVSLEQVLKCHEGLTSGYYDDNIFADSFVGNAATIPL